MNIYEIYDNNSSNKIVSDASEIEKIAKSLNMKYRLVEEMKFIKTVDDISLLKAQLKAQTERSDFIEDCIAEMAGVVYNTEETT